MVQLRSLIKHRIAHCLRVPLNDRIHFMAYKICSQVLDQLINLMQNDPLWEVKVEAINGKLKVAMKAISVIFNIHIILLKGIVHLK